MGQPTVQRVSSYLRYSGRDGNVLATAAHDPNRNSNFETKRGAISTLPTFRKGRLECRRQIRPTRGRMKFNFGSGRKCGSSDHIPFSINRLYRSYLVHFSDLNYSHLVSHY